MVLDAATHPQQALRREFHTGRKPAYIALAAKARQGRRKKRSVPGIDLQIIDGKPHLKLGNDGSNPNNLSGINNIHMKILLLLKDKHRQGPMQFIRSGRRNKDREIRGFSRHVQISIALAKITNYG